MRKVWKEGNKIISEKIEEADYSKEDGGRMKRVVTLEMDLPEAKRQITWIEGEIKKTKSELKALRESIDRKGVQNYINDQRKRMKQFNDHLKEIRELLCLYQKAME